MKKLLLIVAIILVLFFSIIIAIPLFVKGKIVQVIKDGINKELNATVGFDNDIELSLLRSFPNIYLGVDAIEVINKDQFSGDTLLKMKSFVATIDIISVIQGNEIRIRSIKLIDPAIHAKVLKDGSANWDIMKASESDSLKVEVDTSAAFVISLKHYEIQNATVVYDDQLGNMKAEIAGLNHIGKGDFSKDDFILETTTLIESLSFMMDGVPYLNKVNTELVCDLAMNLPAMRFEFKENTLRMNALEVGFDGFVAMPEEDIQMDLRLISKKASLKEILSLVPLIYSKEYDKMQAGGDIALDFLLKGILNTEREQYPAFDLKLILEDGSLIYAGMPEQLKNIQLNLRVNNQDGELDHTVVNLQRLDFLFGKDPFGLKLLLTSPISQPFVDLQAKGTLELGNIKKLMPLDSTMTIAGNLVSDVKAKGHVSSFTGDDYEAMQAQGSFLLSNFVFSEGNKVPLMVKNMDLAISPQKLEIKQLTGNYGHSDYSITGQLENYLGYAFKSNETLKGSMNVRSKLFDCNSFLSADGSEQTEAPSPADTMSLEAFLVPANIDFNLDLNIEKALYDNYQMDLLKGNAKVKDQTLYLNDISFGLFEGKLNLNGSYATTNTAKPSSKIKLGIENADIKTVYSYVGTLQKIAPIIGYINGRFNGSVDLSMLFNKDMTPVLSSISSNGFLRTIDAVMSGFKPMDVLAETLKISTLKQLQLIQTNVSYAVTDGKIKLTKAVDIKEKGIQLHIYEEGYTTFDQAINFDVKLGIASALFGGKGNEAINKLFENAGQIGINLKMPEVVGIHANIGGTLTNPKITTRLNDVKEKTIDRVRDEINRIVDEKKEDLKRQAELEKQKRIKEANEKGDRLIADAKKQADAIKVESRKQADAVLAEGDKQVEDLIKKAGSNPLAIAAAKKSGDIVKQEARKKANDILSDGDKRAQEIVKKAENDKAKLVADAEAK